MDFKKRFSSEKIESVLVLMGFFLSVYFFRFSLKLLKIFELFLAKFLFSFCNTTIVLLVVLPFAISKGYQIRM